jgi:hypothetical protein
MFATSVVNPSVTKFLERSFANENAQLAFESTDADFFSPPGAESLGSGGYRTRVQLASDDLFG